MELKVKEVKFEAEKSAAEIEENLLKNTKKNTTPQKRLKNNHRG